MKTLAGHLVHIIDDDELVLEALVDLFREKGASVISSSSVEDAYRKVREAEPDIIVCDYNLDNDTNGEELLNDLSFLKGNRPICILMSGKVVASQISEDSSIVSAFLHKPFDFDQLFDALDKTKSSIDHMKDVINIFAYSYEEMVLEVKAGKRTIESEFQEASKEVLLLSTQNEVFKGENCRIKISNFLNDKNTECLIEGEIEEVELEDDFYFFKVKVSESFRINWSRLFGLLEKRNEEINTFIKKANE